MNTVYIDGEHLTINDIVSIARDGAQVLISESAVSAVEKSRLWVEKAIKESRVMYGITTGFGAFKNKAIGEAETAELQLNLIRSHACGVGDPFSEDVARTIMLLRANSLSKGYSGVRLQVIEKLLELINKRVYPFIPSQGSVGSSGDLAPLCHMALVLLGEGECIVEGKRVPSIEVLKEKGIEPIILSSKEGLGLSNGTNVQTAVLTLAVHDAGVLVDSADVVAALSVEALNGTKKAYDKKISEVRNQRGQIDVAKRLWDILETSTMVDLDDKRVQDSYSLRCVPQVHGAIRDTYDHVKEVVEREINAATDNPLIFVDEDVAISGGNFHGEPIAIASDILKIAISELANISERRTAKMIDPATNEGLPAFLISKEKGGLHNGLMIPQYAAAALVSENKVLAHPASVDSIPTSANQEDHVSMGTIAARQVAMIVQNTRNVLAIELLNNTQAVDLRSEGHMSKVTENAYKIVRSQVPSIQVDRTFYQDIEKIAQLLYEKKFVI